MNRARVNLVAPWVRVAGGVAVVAVVVWRIGAGPFLAGVRAMGGWALLAAVVITAVTTLASAWRWRAVARGLGLRLGWRPAVWACYRSQFLNSVLPGGVLGDVHRGVRHGRDSGALGRGLRSVAWERAAGQVVQAVLAAVVLVSFDSPVRAAMGPAVAFAGAGVVLVGCSMLVIARTGSSRAARIVAAVRSDIRLGLVQRGAWLPVLAGSTLVVAGHTAVFIIAAHAAAPGVSFEQVLPLAMLVLIGMGVPLGVGGWGPREGIAAWAFGAAGLGADRGVATAACYGVMAFVATLPGAIVLLAERRQQPVPLPEVPRWSVVHG